MMMISALYGIAFFMVSATITDPIVTVDDQRAIVEHNQSEPELVAAQVVVVDACAGEETKQQDDANGMVLVVPQDVIVVDGEAIVQVPPKASVTIVNTIKDTMLNYKHWTGTYSPDLFNIFINDVLVAADESYILESFDTPFTVSFDYSFMKGMRKGTRRYTCTFNDISEQANLTFSWLEKNKIILDNAVIAEE